MSNYEPHVKKQIIKNFAEQAGISKELFLGGLCVIDLQDLERFDEIIRQDERNATPPKHEWMDLHKDEIKQILNDGEEWSSLEFAQAVSDLLREKNA
jgi:hypothetical protein